MSSDTDQTLPPITDETRWLGKDLSDKRHRILYAAQKVFAEYGFRTAEVKQVAVYAGVGKATIYKFFPSKEALLLTVVEETLNHIRDIALANLIGDGHPIAKLEAVAIRISQFLQQNRDFCKVLIQEAGDFMGEIQKHHLALIEQNLPLAEALFSSLRSEGYFVALSTRETIQLMVDLLLGATYTWTITDSPLHLKDSAVRYMRVLVEGLKTPKEKIEAPSFPTSPDITG